MACGCVKNGDVRAAAVEHVERPRHKEARPLSQRGSRLDEDLRAALGFDSRRRARERFRVGIFVHIVAAAEIDPAQIGQRVERRRQRFRRSRQLAQVVGFAVGMYMSALHARRRAGAPSERSETRQRNAELGMGAARIIPLIVREADLRVDADAQRRRLRNLGRERERLLQLRERVERKKIGGGERVRHLRIREGGGIGVSGLPIARRQPRQPRFIYGAAGEPIHALAERPQDGEDGAGFEGVKQSAAGGARRPRRRARRNPQPALRIDISRRNRRAQSEPRFGLNKGGGVHACKIALGDG